MTADQNTTQLTPIRPLGLNRHGQREWLFMCSCGREHVTLLARVKRGHTKSCGCTSRQRTIAGTFKHGMIGTSEYKTWATMIQRCTNPNLRREWPRYGGRGIRVCDRWMAFELFFADMGLKPSPAHTIDRINTNGHYEPGNCRWATPQEQGRNTRRNHYLTFNGETRCVADWEDHLGFKRGAVKCRIRRGWSVEQALTLPLGSTPGRGPRGPYRKRK